MAKKTILKSMKANERAFMRRATEEIKKVYPPKEVSERKAEALEQFRAAVQKRCIAPCIAGLVDQEVNKMASRLAVKPAGKSEASKAEEEAGE